MSDAYLGLAHTILSIASPAQRLKPTAGSLNYALKSAKLELSTHIVIFISL